MPETSQRLPEDAKAWFYLDNHKHISEWIKLREDGRELFLRALWALSPRVEALAAELAVDVVGLDSGSEHQPVLGLRRTDWTSQLTAPLSVALGWDERKLCVPGTNEWPFVGIYVEQEHSDANWTAMRTELLQTRRAFGHEDPYFPWAVWRYETGPQGSGAIDPDGIADQMMVSLRQLWDLAAPVLDQMNLSVPADGS